MRAIYFLLMATSLLNVSIARSQDIVGEWATQGYSAKVRIAPCVQAPTLLCGEITWLWDATDAHGAPLRDLNNPKTELKQRPLIGLSLLKDFRRSDSKWIDGSIYDPESGRTYRATLTQRSQDTLEVAGCILFVCRTQVWRRASSLCST